MAEIAMFVVQTKSKYRLISRSLDYLLGLILCHLLFLGLVAPNSSLSLCGDYNCYQGECRNGVCQCYLGWTGDYCDHCSGRQNLHSMTGLVTDGPANYSENCKCSWLIKPNTSTLPSVRGNTSTQPSLRNRPIHIQMLHFITECGWDHLYIYDGDSAFSTLLAAYSGVIIEDNKKESNIEITAKSGSAYLMFFSDLAFNMSGFNISYRVGGCPLKCSGRGVCKDYVCECHQGYIGKGCEIALCPSNCSNHGTCQKNQCVCHAGYIGNDCSRREGKDLWTRLPPVERITGRASHQVALVNDMVWVVGGYSFEDKPMLMSVFNLTEEKWVMYNAPPSVSPDRKGPIPAARHGHSLVFHENQLYMYGGVVGNNISNEFWMYDLTLRVWTLLQNSSWEKSQLAVSGHTAHVVDGVMHVFFGHSPIYGYLHCIQEFYFGNKSWSIPATSGAIVKNTCWHSSVYDSTRHLIYVYGGYHSVSSATNHITDKLYSYNPKIRYWQVLRSSDSPRFLHSAILTSDGFMLTFGGNTHNEASVNSGAKCYSLDFMAYDVECDHWYCLEKPHLDQDVSRFGHAAVSYKNMMYIFNGFNGRMLRDIIKYTTGNCSAFTNATVCKQSKPGVPCSWSGQSCVARSQLTNQKDYVCPPNNDDIMCSKIKNCKSCLSNYKKCSWCNEKCMSSSDCIDHQRKLTNNIKDCPVDVECSFLHSCAQCQLEPNCSWVENNKSCIYKHKNNAKQYRQKCKVPCPSHTTCENCTRAECMWCSSAQRCVDMNSYVVSFLYGQCTKWNTDKNLCTKNRCSDIRTCKECQMNPICGWCHDESNTGLGQCKQGGMTSSPATCPPSRWYFVTCPLCQCNGHSVCNETNNVCIECQNNTTGETCDRCQKGYFGAPQNGGLCKPCNCNQQAKLCDEQSGDCHCGTRGVVGKKCEWCDTTEKYIGNPNDGGTCYYQLLTDYQFTFNLSKPNDEYYTQINFMNRPSAGDRDVDFSVNCTRFANLNISYNSTSEPAGKVLDSNVPCYNYKMKFSHKQYTFGASDNTTFYVYVYNFETPFSLQITFTQQRNIDLVNFFVTFFSCFLSLLLIAAIFWKIKQKYDVYRRRQRMFAELEQMASRPFAVVSIDIERRLDGGVTAEKKEKQDYRKKKKVSNKPSPIALEPLNGQKAAVLSLLVQLPCGDEDYTPSNQSGLAIASALVSLGNPRKQSGEPNKSDRNKHRRHTHQSHPDACI
ncbi:attractin-like protein 1 isoform X2 [Argonauta hians]